MQIEIAQNIRKFRKERGLTQEQLAEALGVTIGAVSKWELGASVPDISLIMELADFYEVSVDVLLGYAWQSGSMGETLERLKEANRIKNYEEGIKEAEKALKKYPNNFEITCYSATLYEVAGIKEKNEKAMRRAVELFQRACELIGQNTDTEISEISIQMEIAEIMIALGEVEQAIELLKRYNHGGVNNAMIGYALSSFCGKTEEALPYLSKAMIMNITELFRTNLGFLMAFWDKGDAQQALSILNWTLDILRGLKTGTCVSYLDRMEAFLLPIGAGIMAARADESGAREYMKRAYKLAKSFDAAPCYNMTGIRYYCGDMELAAADDMGNTAMESIENVVYQLQEKDAKAGEMVKVMWEALKNGEEV